MGKAFPLGFIAVIAVIFATLMTIGLPFSSEATQGLEEGCLAGGVAPRADYYLPNLLNGFVVVSDERRDAEQLAATFPDPADALSRLHAYCWTGQAERVYVREQLTVDVSIHTFLGLEGATLAQRWFSYHRVKEADLRNDFKSRAQLEEELREEEMRPVNIEALANIFIDAFYNDTEYTLYARRGDLVTRVSVSGEPSVSSRSREFVAYQVLALVFGVDLFNYPNSVP